MAAAATLISVEEYLRTTYRPDCDYIDGEVVERNVGEKEHGVLQGFFFLLFRLKQDEWGVQVIPEQRVQVQPERFRIPDVTVISVPSADERIIRTAPLLCIEILSREDRMDRIRERVADYRRMGVRVTWVVDPWRRLAFQTDVAGKLIEQEAELSVPETAIHVAVREVFEELDLQERRRAGLPS